jgi:hypothetical protein
VIAEIKITGNKAMLVSAQCKMKNHQIDASPTYPPPTYI